MSRQSPPAPSKSPDDDHHVDDHPRRPLSASPRSPPPAPPPDPLGRPSSHPRPAAAAAATPLAAAAAAAAAPAARPSPSSSSSHQPQTTTSHNARHHLGPGPDPRQQHQQQHQQQPIPLQLQPAPSSPPVHSYPQNRQITLEPQRPSASSPKHQSAKGGVRGRITVVCAECKRLKLRCDRQRPCTSCVKRACTERCKYRSELDFVPPPDPPSKPPINNGHELPYRLVSQSCIECSNQRVKCDRKEPCGSCFKRGLTAECSYANLPPLPTQHQWNWLTSRLTRLEAQLAELVTAPPCHECYEKGLDCDRNLPCSRCNQRKTPRCTYPASRSPPSSHHSPPGYPAQPPSAVSASSSNAPDMVIKRVTALENTLTDYIRNAKVGSSAPGLSHQSPHPPSHHSHPSLQLPPVNIPSSPPHTSRHQYGAPTSAAQLPSASAGPPEISNIMSLLSAPPPNRGSGGSGSSGHGPSVTLGANAGMGHRHTPPITDYRDQRPASRGQTSEIEEDELAMEDVEET